MSVLYVFKIMHYIFWLFHEITRAYAVYKYTLKESHCWEEIQTRNVIQIK